MKKILIIFVLCLLSIGCKEQQKEIIPSYSEITQMLEKNEATIVDVRTKNEYDTSHVKGAINIPYDEIKENMLDKNKTIFVYCQSGTRSKIAYQKLLDLGFKVYDLKAYEDIQLLKE